MCGQVRVWSETTSIPTYRIGDPDRNPMFLEKRVYQGASGVVYPHPVIDKIYDEVRDKEYEAVYLENDWLKVMILPEIGGRVQMALDKTNGHHFVYHNSVIKPALVGLAGPWISGGIEFNWPQHHRPSTFDPLDWTIVENDDGSKTLWCGEIETMFRTKGMHGFTLYPDRAYLRIDAKLYNRTSEAQTFLWWANPAVEVNDEYQSIFPQDVHAVMDHGKRDVSSFPIATGVYYKMNYAPGTDISRYKNIPVPTSYMAYRSDYDFLGCYDHGKRAGMLHVADHHIAPGKKQWTWGNGDFGQAWDRQLTDADGPYIELMCGCYTDNQPDFTWLMPYEEKTFTQVFMPYKDIGAVKNASLEVAINLEITGSGANIGVYVTRPRTVTVKLSHKGACLWSEASDLAPDRVLEKSVSLAQGIAAHEVTLAVYDQDEHVLLDFTPIEKYPDDIPAPAKAALPPEAVTTTEQLYLTGLHLEQYHHATFDPQPYYEEALRRDPTDVRNNNALGMLLYRRGRFVEAQARFRAAIATLTSRNPNPYDGEPHYNLGLALKAQGRTKEAFDAFFKAVWTAAWQDAGYFELARLSARDKAFEQALDFVQRSLIRNWHNHKARALKAALLRRLGRLDEAWAETEYAHQVDPLDYGALNERVLITEARGNRTLAQRLTSELIALMGRTPQSHREIALDYAHAGLATEALDLLDRLGERAAAMDHYYAGWIAASAGDDARADTAFALARRAPLGASFPNELEAIAALETALKRCPKDARAPYLLGNYLYHRRDADRAIALWERARAIDPKFPTVHRNLGLAYFNKRRDASAALQAFETAFALDPSDARVFFELDQLRRRLGQSPKSRMDRLTEYPQLVEARDDLAIERITLANTLGHHNQALALLLNRTFHPWEGGEGKTSQQYVQALRHLALQDLAAGAPQAAITKLEQAKIYPPSLGEGKLAGAMDNPLDYALGLAYEALGDSRAAQACFQKASVGLSEPTSATYYNDQPPDTILYQGLALQKIGKEAEAKQRFESLVTYGLSHIDDHMTIDYFAVSLPDFLVFDENLNRKNKIHCLYMMGLGLLGLGDHQAAVTRFDEVLSLDPAHQGAVFHRQMAV